MRPLAPGDVAACAELAAAAFGPDYALQRQLLGDDLFERLRPDWQAPRAPDVERLATAAGTIAWVVEESGHLVGFVIAGRDDATRLGYLDVLAVAPHRQRAGVGTALVDRALGELRGAGMARVVTMLRSGPGCEAARLLLGKVGFAPTAIQSILYHQPLVSGRPAEPPPGVRRISPDDVGACRRFGVDAFRPVFAAFEEGYGPDLFRQLRPDWEVSQGDYIESACLDPEKETWVHEVDGEPAGLLVLVEAHPGVGQIELLVVAPEAQGGGIGGGLNAFALDRLREWGMVHAIVGTGDDPGHAPARRSYEKVGFRPLPIQSDLQVSQL